MADTRQDKFFSLLAWQIRARVTLSRGRRPHAVFLIAICVRARVRVFYFFSSLSFVFTFVAISRQEILHDSSCRKDRHQRPERGWTEPSCFFFMGCTYIYIERDGSTVFDTLSSMHQRFYEASASASALCSFQSSLPTIVVDKNVGPNVVNSDLVWREEVSILL